MSSVPTILLLLSVLCHKSFRNSLFYFGAERAEKLASVSASNLQLVSFAPVLSLFFLAILLVFALHVAHCCVNVVPEPC